MSKLHAENSMVVSCGLFGNGSNKGSYPSWIAAFIVPIIIARARSPPLQSEIVAVDF